MSTAASRHPNAKHASSFDAHHPPEKKYIDECVHCGFCLPACPTYVLWGEEMDSPRGRIYMIKKAAEGEAPLDSSFQTHMDNCLGCMACMTACPSGVEYNKLIEPTRAQIERNLPRGLPANRSFASCSSLPSRIPSDCACWRCLCCVYQKSGLRSLVRATGVLKLLPKRLAAMESLLPEVPGALLQQIALGHFIRKLAPRRRVGMLSGCVQQVFFSPRECCHGARAGR